jgi:hypothetical protein
MKGGGSTPMRSRGSHGGGVGAAPRRGKIMAAASPSTSLAARQLLLSKGSSFSTPLRRQPAVPVLESKAKGKPLPRWCR